MIGAILAGGQGTRIGEPKASLELGGRPLLEHPAHRLRPCADRGGRGGEARHLAAAPADRGVAGAGRAHAPAPRNRHRARATPAAAPCSSAAATCRSSRRGCSPSLAATDEPLVVPTTGGRLHPLLARYEPVAARAAAQRARRAADHFRRRSPALEPALIDEAELHELGDPRTAPLQHQRAGRPGARRSNFSARAIPGASRRCWRRTGTVRKTRSQSDDVTP